MNEIAHFDYNQRDRPLELNSNMDNYNKLTGMGNDSWES